MKILGIESSCDETAASVLADGRVMESNVVASQIDLHRKYGGVMPEVASRAHLKAILPTVEEAMERAGVGWSDISALAVTRGPGLAGSLLVGVNAAKAISMARDIPLVGVNHLEGHIYSNWVITDQPFPEPAFPLICMVVSGGHTDLYLMTDHGVYRRLGSTRDDAAGEAFDKVARILGVGYPGGPAIQKAAKGGNPNAFPFPRAKLGDSYDFSFSGLKTAVLRTVQSIEGELPVADLAASFQEAVVDILTSKMARAAEEFGAAQGAICGGVSANLALREMAKERLSVPLHIPPINLCTDNAAMIASAGYYRFVAGARDGLDLDVSPNLSL
ncbi:MAG TPA: tRNA (adenosine(37)-N6)-threonylcarbamoyltransferase complex transferase subunit TsaD [Chloroflexota bacterium]|nr:tRNA (adenosine(37)-N6)-threonylcarbamoyltransferase complex transferase subunit TsaD [Chloroflexota bacterium]